MTRYRKNSIVFIWLISYVIILVIPVVISSLGHYKINGIVENEINTTNSAILKQIQYSVDNINGRKPIPSLLYMNSKTNEQNQ